MGVFAGAMNAAAMPGAALNSATVPAATIGSSTFCGRYLNAPALVAGVAPAGMMEDGTVCSRVTPFTLGVRFDDRESTAGTVIAPGVAAIPAAAAAMQAVQEASSAQMAVGGAMVPSEPLGTAGFSLDFRQFAC